MKLDFFYSACPGLRSGATPAQDERPESRTEYSLNRL